MKKIILVSVFLSLFLLVIGKVWAYDLTLTAVGSQSTLGTDYSLVTYVGGVPSLVGTASPSAQVGVRINTVLNYTTASTSGVWQYVPTSLNQGDNTVVIASGTQAITFTLRFNATASATLSATPVVVADETELVGAGVWEYYLPALALGLGVWYLGRYGKRRMQKWEKGD